MKTYEEMVKRAKEMNLEELESCYFYTNMVDRWTYEDRMWASVLSEEIYNRKVGK